MALRPSPGASVSWPPPAARAPRPPRGRLGAAAGGAFCLSLAASGRRGCLCATAAAATWLRPRGRRSLRAHASVTETLGQAEARLDVGGVSEISDLYDGFLLDQYGVLHDGERPLPGALECLSELRRAGKRLAVVSNSPCEGARMEARLRKLGLDPGLFDGLVTSGDLVRRHLDELLRAAGGGPAPRVAYVSHAEHERRAVWSPEELRGLGFELASRIEDADFVLANGVEVCFKGTPAAAFSNFERDADDWGPLRALLEGAAERALPLVVANPDRVIVRADGSMVNCPGMLADEYERLGGPRPRRFGKPGQEIFSEARSSLAALGAARVCHVGDSLHHDIGGAQAADLPTLFVRGGIHAAELSDGAELLNLCSRYGAAAPTHAVPFFNW